MNDLTRDVNRRNHPAATEPVQVVTVERTTSDWVIVHLDGRVVFRRLTRDPLFTRVFVRWPSNGSENPRTLASFSGAALGGAWRPVPASYVGTEFALPPVGERWHYRRQPDIPRSDRNAFGRPGGWVRDGAVAHWAGGGTVPF